MLIACTSASSQTVYSTLADGNWNNGSNVWSVNGSTPCNCAPGMGVNTFEVVVNHDIVLTGNIAISAGKKVTVSAGASLSSSSKKITVTNGELNAAGVVDVDEIDIKTQGSATFLGPVTAASKFQVSGFARFDSLVTVTSANMELKTGSMTELHPGVRLDIPNGSISNEGTLDFQGACVSVTNGNLDNQSNGTVSGVGTITLGNGNINNSGTWGNDVMWCTPNGTGSNMPIGEDCSGNGCTILPVRLISFEAIREKNTVKLQWRTASESDTRSFKVERSAGDDGWDYIGEVDAQSCSCIASYTLIDEQPIPGRCQYRLITVDHDGAGSVIAYSRTAIESHTRTLSLASTPDGQLSVTFMADKPGMLEFLVTDISGRILHSSRLPVDDHRPVVIEAPIKPVSGIIIATWTFGGEWKAERVVVGW